MIYSTLAFAALASLTSSVVEATPFNWGHAVFTYGPLHCGTQDCQVLPSCNEAEWAGDIDTFNKGASSAAGQISTIYSYGGDIEFWTSKKNKTGCHAPASEDLAVCNVSVYFDPVNAQAAQKYRSSVTGVDSIIALLDSRMDGWQQLLTYGEKGEACDVCEFGDFYPNLHNLTNNSLDSLAKRTAQLYCKEDVVDGIQVDLEPYAAPYAASLDTFVSKLGSYLRDEDKSTGCRDAKHPEGRTVAYFTFAHDHKGTHFSENVLGDSGFYVFSGYDLDPKDSVFTYNSPEEYKTKLYAEVGYFEQAIGKTGKFSIALPFGATCHEYEHYVPGKHCGPACTAQNSGATMEEYVKVAFEVLLDEKWGSLFCMSSEKNTQFLGISWWSYSHEMTYPPMKWFDNKFLPGVPTEGALQVAQQYLPQLTTTTCRD